MNRLRDQLFAGSAFSDDQDRVLCRGGRFRVLDTVLHSLGAMFDIPKRVFRKQAFFNQFFVQTTFHRRNFCLIFEDNIKADLDITEFQLKFICYEIMPVDCEQLL